MKGARHEVRPGQLVMTADHMLSTRVVSWRLVGHAFMYSDVDPSWVMFVITAREPQDSRMSHGDALVMMPTGAIEWMSQGELRTVC